MIADVSDPQWENPEMFADGLTLSRQGSSPKMIAGGVPHEIIAREGVI